MNRRRFVAAMLMAPAFGRGGATGHRSVRIGIDVTRRMSVIPPDFLGLGYEISSAAIPGLLSAKNQQYVRLLRTLGPAGVIRVGGNTSDDASFSAVGPAVSAPKGTVVTPAHLRELAGFLNATGWKLIWGLNLGSGTEQAAVEEAEAIRAAVGDRLFALEIGNEPDQFTGGGHRPGSYGFENYLAEYQRYKAAIRARLPHVPFAGPDVAVATDWVTRFSTSEGTDLELLTHHYYRQCKGPTSTLDLLLHPDPKLAPQMTSLKAASASSGVPFRICEVNSFCGGGQPGVSDTFGAALWALDYLFLLASAGCAGVNMETGVNQMGFVSSYSPIVDNLAKPVYYGMLAFAQASQGQMVGTEVEAEALNLTAYAVHGQRELWLTVVNKDELNDANVTIRGVSRFGKGRILRLSAPSIQSQESITLGGVAVKADGTWRPETSEISKREVYVPAGSAAILRWSI